MTSTPPSTPVRPLDYLGVAVFCLLLFGYAMFDGRPLSLHEARLPQTSREMMANGDWLIPRSGGRPWLERPPLPHWIEVGVSTVLGQKCDSVWVVRLPAVLMGTIITLLTLKIAGTLFGRGTGVVSALVLATSYEFYTYSTLAEDDIFLAACVVGAMACFVTAEFGQHAPGPAAVPENPLGKRPWPVLGFFALLGLSNLAKGPLVGTAVAAVTCAAFLFWGNPRRALRYVWLWGWVVYAAIAAFWPLLVMRRYADVRKNWFFDYSGTEQYDQPFWYYGVQILGGLAPWTPAVLVGLWKIARSGAAGGPSGRVPPGDPDGGERAADRAHTSPARFLLCWAVLPILVLSIPHRKHHHYLVPSLAPWAILGAIGLVDFAKTMFRGVEWSRRPGFGLLVFGVPGAVVIALLHKKIPGPMPIILLLTVVWVLCVFGFYLGLHRRSRSITFASVLFGLVVAFCWGQTFLPDLTTDDTAFLRRVEAQVPRDVPLTINADLRGELYFFRNAFYVRPTAILLHNLTFLRDEKLTASAVYVVTRAKDLSALQTLGEVELIDQSPFVRRKQPETDRFTLYRLRFRTGLQRYPATPPDQITTMQAMGRVKGPYCGPEIK